MEKSGFQYSAPTTVQSLFLWQMYNNICDSFNWCSDDCVGVWHDFHGRDSVYFCATSMQIKNK